MSEGFTWMEGTSAKPWSFIDPQAIIGRPPEIDGWRPGDEFFLPVIHCAARIEPFATIDSGSVRPTIIGAIYMLKHSHVGHDCVIGDGSVISTGAIIGGLAEIGRNVHVGLGAIVLPYRTIGDGTTIGAGAVVTRDVLPGETVAGNPARPIDPNLIPYSERR